MFFPLLFSRRSRTKFWPSPFRFNSRRSKNWIFPLVSRPYPRLDPATCIRERNAHRTERSPHWHIGLWRRMRSGVRLSSRLYTVLISDPPEQSCAWLLQYSKSRRSPCKTGKCKRSNIERSKISTSQKQYELLWHKRGQRWRKSKIMHNQQMR